MMKIQDNEWIAGNIFARKKYRQNLSTLEKKKLQTKFNHVIERAKSRNAITIEVNFIIIFSL